MNVIDLDCQRRIRRPIPAHVGERMTPIQAATAIRASLHQMASAADRCLLIPRDELDPHIAEAYRVLAGLARFLERECTHTPPTEGTK